MSITPCGACGAWAPGSTVCPACGAPRSAVVPLDRARGDGRSVVVLTGPVDAVRDALSSFAAPGEASTRVEAARALLQRVPGPVRCAIDLRGVEVGHVVRRTRVADRSEALLVLPWLVVRHAAGEVRVVRTARRRVQHGFVGHDPVARASEVAHDEVTIAGPAGAWRGALAHALREAPVADGGPRPGRLPATAPDPDGAVEGALGQGALLALALGLAAAVLVALGSPARLDVRGAVDDLSRGASRAAVASLVAAPALARPVVLAALDDPRPWSRRNALAASAVLGGPERLRLLERSARHDLSPEVRDLARDLLALEGDAGATRLAGAAADRGAHVVDRGRALGLVSDLDPRRGASVAASMLQDAPDGLRPSLAGALAGGGAAAVPVLDRLLDDPDLATRAAAARARCAAAPVDALAGRKILRALLASFDRGGLATPPDPDALHAQVILATAALRAGLPPEHLRGASAHPGASPIVAARLRAAR